MVAVRYRRLVPTAACAAALILTTGAGATASPATTPQQDRPAVQPLPANLEAIRAAEATRLYGDPAVRPLDDRKSALFTMGDSEMSGEGAGNYEPGTHQDGNWCDRSLDQAVWRLTISADVRYNVACSGGEPIHLIEGSGAQQWNELNQGDNLAIRARNTKIKLVWVTVGANGAGTIEFGNVAADCAADRLFFRGPCWPTYTDQWATRANGTRDQAAAALTAIKQTMANAGYLASDYELVVQSYPSPVSPDVEDNPSFPGWYAGGCLLYLADMAFARNKAGPMFTDAVRQAAALAGVRYLDAGRLFHGHESCTEDPMARGLVLEAGIWDLNAARQSYHPSARGHGVFAQCMDQFYASGLGQATCLDPASTGQPVLYGGLLEFRQLRNLGTNTCADAQGYNSRYNTAMLSYGCHGGRNQGFWLDPLTQGLHVELNHDRCLESTGAVVRLHNCDNLANQKWVLDGARIHPAGNAGLCVGFTASGVLGTAACAAGNARQTWSFEPRTAGNPVGYGHSDWIGSRVY